MGKSEREILGKYRESIKEMESMTIIRICEQCGSTHPATFHIGDNLQITPIYRHNRPCDDYMRDRMREIRALQKRLGLSENIC